MIKYSVCIATYKRQELLKKLIDSLLNQKNIDLSEVELIIVDNDDKGSARTIVDSYFGKVSCSLSYEIQPEKNIAITRNIAVKKASGEYIFFIDDDEYADENWMYTHINNLLKYNADGAIGRVKSYFHVNAPKWITDCPVYHRDANPSGEIPALLNTGNCMIKSEFFIKKGYKFDPEYGISGGSDHHLFSKLISDGAKFVSCFEAITYEFVPSERANIKWLVKRVFRTGNNFTRTHIIKNNKQSIPLSIIEFFKGILQAILALFISIFFIWNRTKSFHWFLRAISNIAKPFAVLGIYPDEYKEQKTK
ncbi:MAG: glycosyltransferase family 2 protein [Ignavibacteriales bacterium]|nr:glycosyltransferase family 2 protein [Ignavibacteriales bacterium]